MDQGERFAFTSLHSEFRVRVGGQLVLLDRFSFEPAENIAASPANFAGYQTFFSLFLVGSPDDEQFQLLGKMLARQKMPGSTDPHFQVDSQACVVSVTQARANVWVLRAAAPSRMALQPLCAAVLAALADEVLLVHNPLARKY